ncbi:MAG TPA: Na+/H+ antiporter NhaA [Burkholderiales bacterium]
MRVVVAIKDFLALESAGGILLACAALAAMLLANSPLDHLYLRFLDTPVEVRIGNFEIAKTTLLWINDGLMAVFFFLVGLELKREAMEGELSSRAQIMLPALAAAGGMAAPAAIYAWINWGDPLTLHGWAIPAATDIAFALGVLSLFGNRVPVGLKVFLLTLAILDDVGAIVIIALFYTDNLVPGSLGIAAAALAALLVLNRAGVQRAAPYLLVGLVLWASVLKSGVHATLAGIALAFFVPRKAGRMLEHDLHPPVAYVILPLFAFANAGVPLAGLSLDSLMAPLPLGIIAGLVLGKSLGIFGVSWLAIRGGLAPMPAGATWGSLFGLSLLCGVGFTMSLFIGGLAFEGLGPEYAVMTRLGILAGSLIAALAGYAVLRATLRA